MDSEPKTISVTDLRNTTREVLENAHFRGRCYVVERAGQPMAVILGVQEYKLLAAAALSLPASGAPSGSSGNSVQSA